MHRSSGVGVTLICLFMTGCGDDDAASPSTVTTSAAATSTAAATSVVAEDFLTAAGDECGRANQAAFTDAERLGYWDHPLTPDEQAEYYEGRATQVTDLIAALTGLQPSPDFTADWAATLGNLEEYRAWATANVATIRATGSTVDESSPGSLQSFRAAFELGYGHACQDLFDMN